MTTKPETEQKKAPELAEEKHCGIIMPIAPMNGYTKEHWLDVKNIIKEATEEVEDIEFKTEIVSNSDGEIDIIHKRIIQNLYNADIVVCDISGRNPNVMFELGMRLTFDKPTIIIKDDATDFIFDTSSIEHLIYPKDLRFQKIVEFKKDLAKRIKITYEKSKADPKFSTFLGNFGEFMIPKLDQTTVSSAEQLILEEISSLRSEMKNLNKREVANSHIDTKVLENDDYRFAILINATARFIEKHNDSRDPETIVVDYKYLDFLDKECPESADLYIGEKLYAIRKAQKHLNLNHI
ncbi:RNA helicase [Bacillus anthracis]|nr:RNA helicase [Bacillus anthracis]